MAVWNQTFELANIGAIDNIEIHLFNLEQCKQPHTGSTRNNLRQVPVASCRISTCVH